MVLRRWPGKCTIELKTTIIIKRDIYCFEFDHSMINAFIYKKEREDLLKSFAHVTRINYEWNARTRENTIIIRCGRIHINSTARGRINRSRMHHFERWTSIDGTHRYSFSGLPPEKKQWCIWNRMIKERITRTWTRKWIDREFTSRKSIPRSSK